MTVNSPWWYQNPRNHIRSFGGFEFRWNSCAGRICRSLPTWHYAPYRAARGFFRCDGFPRGPARNDANTPLQRKIQQMFFDSWSDPARNSPLSPARSGSGDVGHRLGTMPHGLERNQNWKRKPNCMMRGLCDPFNTRNPPQVGSVPDARACTGEQPIEMAPPAPPAPPGFVPLKESSCV